MIQIKKMLNKHWCSIGSASSSADVLEDLKKIDVAISGQQLEYTIQKNRLTAHSLQLSLDSKAQPEVIQSTKKSKVQVFPLSLRIIWTCLLLIESSRDCALPSRGCSPFVIL